MSIRIWSWYIFELVVAKISDLFKLFKLLRHQSCEPYEAIYVLDLDAYQWLI